MQPSEAGITISDILGLCGVFLYIGSYFILQAGLIRGDGYAYAACNLIAASFVLASLMEKFNLSSAVIQVTYILISVLGITRIYLMSRRITFTETERAFLRVVAPNLTKLNAKKLVKLGKWEDLEAGAILTVENDDVEFVTFIYSGAARVLVGGAEVAQLGDNALVGEMSCLTGNPATATVTITASSHVFRIETDRLETFLNRNQSVRYELEARFAGQVSEKLAKANEALLQHKTLQDV